MNNKPLLYYVALIFGAVAVATVINLIIPGPKADLSFIEAAAVYFVSGMFAVIWLK
jgi:hypothetical protein